MAGAILRRSSDSSKPVWQRAIRCVCEAPAGRPSRHRPLAVAARARGAERQAMRGDEQDSQRAHGDLRRVQLAEKARREQPREAAGCLHQQQLCQEHRARQRR
eukprot:161315-Prymnesium_polylepis.1